jgi:hypothetical protein
MEWTYDPNPGLGDWEFEEEPGSGAIDIRKLQGSPFYVRNARGGMPRAEKQRSAWRQGVLKSIHQELPCGFEYYSFYVNGDQFSMEQLAKCAMDPFMHYQIRNETQIPGASQRWLQGYRKAFE